ncbi:MAG: phosphate ABC transporter substrate-binding protein [Euryarchaeota archaeon]|nr:phosphate ABC transporter substrate-binding protein [Euryarchaeota archaeon]
MEKPDRTHWFLPHTIVVTLLIAVITASLLGSGCIDNTKLQVAGSTTVLPIAEECARVFMEEHPDIDVYVSGGGSSHGIKSVAEGTVDIGDASRDMKDSEKKKHPDLVPHAVAKDGVAVVVHPENEISDLTLEELQDICTGEITNWKDLGGEDSEIMVVSREEGSGTRDCFEHAVLKPIKKEIVDSAIIQDSNGKMRTTVAGNKKAIGFLSLGYVNSDVKAVRLDDTEPTIENLRSGRYAITRTLWMITKGEPDEIEQAFLDFVLSEDGQKIVGEVHFIPVR